MGHSGVERSEENDVTIIPLTYCERDIKMLSIHYDILRFRLNFTTWDSSNVCCALWSAFERSKNMQSTWNPSSSAWWRSWVNANGCVSLRKELARVKSIKNKTSTTMIREVILCIMPKYLKRNSCLLNRSIIVGPMLVAMFTTSHDFA